MSDLHAFACGRSAPRQQRHEMDNIVKTAQIRLRQSTILLRSYIASIYLIFSVLNKAFRGSRKAGRLRIVSIVPKYYCVIFINLKIIFML